MDGSTIGIFIFLAVNLLVYVFGAGKLYQKVGDLSRHIEKLEKKLENTDQHLDNLAERVARLEGKFERR